MREADAEGDDCCLILNTIWVGLTNVGATMRQATVSENAGQHHVRLIPGSSISSA